MSTRPPKYLVVPPPAPLPTFQSLTQYHEAQNLLAAQHGGRQYQLPVGQSARTVPSVSTTGRINQGSSGRGYDSLRMQGR